MDAGGLMAYNSYNQRVQSNQTTLGVPNSGFASRGKNSHIRNISVPVPNPQDQPSVTTPRTGRAQLLAGLRTQPKTPTTTPSTASFGAEISGVGMDSSKYAMPRSAAFAPKTARAMGFSSSPPSAQQNQYSPALPAQPATSPAITMNGEALYDQQDFADAQAYAEMLATTNYILQHRQQQLQQQLMMAQQAQQLQQQLASLNIQSPMNGSFPNNPMNPGMGMYSTQTSQSIPGTSNGMYQVYNPMTGQLNYYMHNQQQQQQHTPSQAYQQLSQLQAQAQLQQQQQQQLQQQQQQQQQQQLQQQQHQQQQFQNQQQQHQRSISPPQPQNNGQLQPPSNSASMNSSRSNSRSRSPPKLGSTQQREIQSMSSSTFRKGHRKASSLSSCVNANGVDVDDAPKTSVPRLSMLPPTPSTATFAPGHASGTHPVRQPRGPPNIEEIKAKPTSKHEGSKNFASRQRRKAVFRLITAGMERRGNRSTSGVMTPVSENDGGYMFEDGESVTSSLSGKQSLQSLRGEPDSPPGGYSPPGYSASSLSGDESTIGGKYVQVKESGLRNSHMLMMEDKRRSAIF